MHIIAQVQKPSEPPHLLHRQLSSLATGNKSCLCLTNSAQHAKCMGDMTKLISIQVTQYKESTNIPSTHFLILGKRVRFEIFKNIYINRVLNEFSVNYLTFLSNYLPSWIYIFTDLICIRLSTSQLLKAQYVCKYAQYGAYSRQSRNLMTL